jgi:O-methyltransferase
MLRNPAARQCVLRSQPHLAAAGGAPATRLVAEARELLEVRRGDPKRALDLLDAAKRAAPDAASADSLRAVAFAQLGDAFAARQAALEELRHRPRNAAARRIADVLRQRLQPALAVPPDVAAAEPLFAAAHDALLDHTMLDCERTLALYRGARDSMAIPDCPADAAIVECGTAGGGSLVMMGLGAREGLQRRHDAAPSASSASSSAARGTDALRHPVAAAMPRLFACDTFSGMPPPTDKDRMTTDGAPAAAASHWADGTCSAPEACVRDLARAFALDVTTVPGLFADALPPLLAADERLSIRMLHVDCDWYESTRDALSLLWPRLVVGGRFQVDDFLYWDGCKRAVHDFFSQLADQPTCSLAGVALVGTKTGPK